MIARKERKKETIRLQRLQRTHSIFWTNSCNVRNVWRFYHTCYILLQRLV